MIGKINWVGVAGGIATLLLIPVSWFMPWWRISIGDPALAQANFSPVNVNFSILGNFLTIPIITALNVSALLFLFFGGVFLLIYSVKPSKPYAKKLLGFSFVQPLLAVILFVVELVVLVLAARALLSVRVPLLGSGNIQLPQLTEGLSVSIAVSANFEWPFYFAIFVAALCIAARLYHRKVAKTLVFEVPPPPPPDAYF